MSFLPREPEIPGFSMPDGFEAAVVLPALAARCVAA